MGKASKFLWDKWVFRTNERDKKVRDNVGLYKAIKLLGRRDLGEVLFSFSLLGADSMRRQFTAALFPKSGCF
jgi:hypothetical protein